MTVKKTTLAAIEQLEDFEDEYVYDVGMKNTEHNWFFANDILVKNTDSVKYNTNVIVNDNEIEIEKAFVDIAKENEVFCIDGNEYVFPSDYSAKTFNVLTSNDESLSLDYIYRHMVNKEMWQVEDEDGNIVELTGDHSIMIERDGYLIESKPSDLNEDDILLSVN